MRRFSWFSILFQWFSAWFSTVFNGFQCFLPPRQQIIDFPIDFQHVVFLRGSTCATEHTRALPTPVRSPVDRRKLRSRKKDPPTQGSADDGPSRRWLGACNGANLWLATQCCRAETRPLTGPLLDRTLANLWLAIAPPTLNSMLPGGNILSPCRKKSSLFHAPLTVPPGPFVQC